MSAPNELELQLVATGNATVDAARSYQIQNNVAYEQAAEFLKEVKRRAKQVSDYWKPMKEQADAAHKGIVAREKAMLQPMADAERIIKTGMQNYQLAQEAERKRIEAETLQRQKEERERLLAEAVAAEKEGDHIGAETNMAMAEMVEDMAPAVIAPPAPVVAGVSNRTTWKARVVEIERVPSYYNGIEIREINESALNALARMTKGTVIVPGVEFYQDTTVSVRT